MRLSVQEALNGVRDRGLRKLFPGKARIGVGLGTCGVGNGAREVFHAIADRLSNRGVEADVCTVGCFGACAAEPLVSVAVPDKPMVILHSVRPEDADEIAEALAYARIPERKALCKIESWDHLTSEVTFGTGLPSVPSWDAIPFFRGQKKIVLRNSGLINPEDIEEYIAIGGYYALYRALTEVGPEKIIDEIRQAKLRGRGGAGFPVASKWDMLRKAAGARKFVVCNADEGDPGAYMNRNEMEGDPHALIEGMVIGAFAMGASEGIVYCRAEYPLAVLRVRRAIEQARALGLLGQSILGTPFSFDLTLVEGAGAFVCGEETALIASLEGRAGRPRPRPPFPSEKGLWGFPTSINNVETWYNVAPILTKGAAWFTRTGTATSTGTKVFSLVGKVKNTGLVEMPLGAPLKEIVYNIGGGTGTSKKVKAVQTGGPSGGCIPAELFDSPVDYESLAAIGAIMGSGGMVVMDEDNCMVDVARYFVEFTRDESCGKCVPCRAGMDQALHILREITEGRATPADITSLAALAELVRDTSLCGLGQNAPNPVLTTLRYFRDEYDQHVVGHRCLPTACESLFVSPCENSCPVHMNIPGYLALLREGREEEALVLVTLDNPLAGTTGRVCQHLCESRCRRAGIDSAVSIREVHRYLAGLLEKGETGERIAHEIAKRKLPTTGKRVAIVGAGPAGLAAAFYLALTGHAVTVFESKPEPGGLLRYALPEYRLPRAVVRREITAIEGLGVEFRCNVRVGFDVSLTDLEQGFDAVFLAIGTWQEAALGIPGADLPNVMSSIDFLDGVASGRPSRIGKSVVVIGGGNSAIDSARTALRLGAEHVRVVYRREKSDMPAIVEETEAAIHEGVRFTFMGIPRRILGVPGSLVTGLEIQRARMSGVDAFGRRVPEATEETESIDCDTVIVAVGEKVDGEVVRRIGVKTLKGDRVAVDAFTLRTPKGRVWAGGDVVSGPANVVTAMGYGKLAADDIDRTLMGSSRVSLMRSGATYANRIPLEPEGGPRGVPIELPLQDRIGSFREVSMGLSRDAVTREASRCLRCDVKVTAEAEEEGGQ